ncbi:ketopantoate reductase PanE/ApbA-domain-containing protein [Bisporella sp. PMI_857]|nr:ketopantoate reductase PanE/ApbA-domain-containing protein [Bisporella sp. PMI_857]
MLEMPPKSSPRVLLFGTGSIGAVYAFILARAKCHVTAVCRSNYDAVKSEGIKITSTIFGSHEFMPDVVAAEVPQGRYDYVVVASKSFPLSNPAELVARAVTPEHTIIALIQNGIDIEAPYKEKFPNNLILSCVVYLPVTQTSLGIFYHKEIERLVIGTYPHSAPPAHKLKAQHFGGLIKAGGATADVKDDVQGERWLKLLANGAWNPICALTRSRDAEFLTQNSSEIYKPALDIIEKVQTEISLLAIASGYPQIDASKVEFQISRAKARITGEENQGVEPSMMADVLYGKQMEVDAIIGNAVRIAERLGLREKVPMLRLLWILAEALNNSVRR